MIGVATVGQPVAGQSITATLNDSETTVTETRLALPDGTEIALPDGTEIEAPVAMTAPDFSLPPQEEIVVEEVIIDETDVDGGIEIVVEGDKPSKPPQWPSPKSVNFDDWLGYNSAKGDTTWLAGSDFGMFSLESFPSLDLGEDSAVMVGTGFHFLNGPVKPDLPPRLFDIHLAYHMRKALSSDTMLDMRVGAGVFSDFEGSARKGVRYPGHIVAYRQWNHDCVGVFGVEVLDRDDISVLPVGGMVWHPRQDWLWELVFPRPKLRLRLNANQAAYVGGELGGGTWAIKRTDFRNENTNDNVTYRDLRVTFGIIRFGEKADGVLELGLAFDRRFEFRSGRGDRPLDDALILRCHTHY